MVLVRSDGWEMRKTLGNHILWNEEKQIEWRPINKRVIAEGVVLNGYYVTVIKYYARKCGVFARFYSFELKIGGTSLINSYMGVPKRPN